MLNDASDQIPQKKTSLLCPYCKKYFLFHSQLQRHIRTHTGERPYACNFCGKRFVELVVLKRHLRIHTGEKPFKCQLCDYSAAQQNGLVYHMTKKHPYHG